MMNAAGSFRAYEELHQGRRYVTYRGLSEQDNSPAIIKTHSSDRPDSNDIARLRHEHGILRDLEIRGVPKVHALERRRNRVTLILRDPGGELLGKLIPSGWDDAGGLPVPQYLQLALSVTATLGSLHKHGIIHGKVNPHTILVDPDQCNTWLLDFSAASDLRRENPRIADPDLLEGDLLYISPEQTGRLYKTLDYRTDFYSLGVTLYETLIGEPPFHSKDALELVHCHMAVQPSAPHRLDSGIPKPVSEIVMKLLAKNPEDRYQSARGLEHDLRECLRQWQTTGSVSEFPLASKDVREALHIPEQLYGREHEAGTLQRLFGNLGTGACEVVMISGHSGIGKTSLVRAVGRKIGRENFLIAAGKCDPLHAATPYSGLTAALRNLTGKILTERDNVLKAFRHDLEVALGGQGQTLLDMIPDLELIIGPQLPVEELGPEETKNRLNRVFLSFMKVFCSGQHPFVVFLDDLQWVDSGTLNMIELVTKTEQLHDLLFIGAYRDNEVGPSHSLSPVLETLGPQDNFTEIRLDRLTPKHITDLLSDMLGQNRTDVLNLAEMVAEKTDGNPFFIRQFLQTLHQDGLMFFDEDQGQWQWDLKSIRHLPSTDNVVDLLISRLERMPAQTRYSLQMAACLGNRFDLDTLGLVTGDDREEALESLAPAIEQDLVALRTETITADDSESPLRTHGHMRFQHDRIQQAAYALIDDTSKRTVHLDIGRTILQAIAEENIEERLYDILAHFNVARDLVRDPGERERLAELNLVAGKRSMASAAFDPAFRYLKSGIELLREDCWIAQRSLARELHTECLEAGRLSGRFDEVEVLFHSVKDNAGSPLDLVSAYRSRIRSFMAQNRLPEAMDNVREILGQLGESLPLRPNISDVYDALEQTQSNLPEDAIEALADLPEMTDSIKLAVMSILDTAISCAFIGEPELFPFIVCKQVNTSIEYGNTTDSAFSYAAFGAMLCKITGDVKTGGRFGELALNLAGRSQDKESIAKVYHAVSGYVDHWTKGLRDTFELAIAGYQSAIDSGDFEFAGYNAYVYSKHSLLVGNSLAEAEQEMAAYSKTLKQLWQEIPLNYNNIFRQAALNLMNSSDDPRLLIGEAYDERTMLPHHRQVSDNLAVYYVYVCKTMLCCLFGDYEQAVMNSDCATTEIARAAGGPAAYPLQVFYDSLARAALYDSSTEAEKDIIVERIAANQKSMMNWASHSPINYEHKFHLVEAVRSRVLGMDEHALAHFNQAIASAREHGFVNEEALANELTAAFAMRKGWTQFANHFAQRAHYCYSLWGASAKVRQLEQTYPTLLGKSARRPMEPGSGSGRFAGQPVIHSSGLDILALLKASEAISSEIEINSLLQTLMQVLIENAGADRGLLVLKYGSTFGIAAEGNAEGAQRVFVPPLAVEDGGRLSPALVNYVIRTQEILVIDDLESDDRFVKDPYFQEHRPHSILCSPIVFQSKLLGTVYLENRLLPYAFSEDHLEVLKLLSTRMASAIENARLYEDLRNAEEKYRSIFENAVEGIYRTTPDGRFIDLNPSAARLLGYDSAEEAVSAVTDITQEVYVNPADRDEFLSLLKKGDFVTGFEAAMYHKSGHVMWVSINARPVFDEQGNLTIIEGFISDVTERKQATDLLIESEENLRKENIILKSNIKDRYRFGRIIGKSQVMQEVYELIVKAAATEANVIIYGESGTGKELVARAIHDTSERNDRPFVPVNCGAIPENLMESEFFGFKKGAFTSANHDKSGYLDRAERGTIFLDELGEITTHLQVKLLRALEGGGYTALGGSELKQPDVRIIAATNRDLEGQVKSGRMRKDFYYRIHIIPIYLPPLRERKEDIPLLVEHFLRSYLGDDRPKIPGRILDALVEYEWPGNIRELQNTIHRYVALHELDFLSAPGQDRGRESGETQYLYTPKVVVPLRDAVGEFEKAYIRRLLDDHGWNRGRVAEVLGVDRKTLYRKMSLYGLGKPQNVPAKPHS